MENKILQTTGDTFDGYYVDKYIDVISEEVIFRNSLMKQIVASVKDFFGSLNILDTEVKGASTLIENGKKYVLERFIKKAKSMGGNAVLGMQFDSTFGVEVIRIAISGTVVHILPSAGKLSETNHNLCIKNSNVTLFSCSSVLCKTVEDMCYISLDIYNPKKDNITGIKCDIIFHTNFDDIYLVKDQIFINFESQSDSHYISAPVICTIPKDIVKILCYTDIMIKKYNIDNSTIEVTYAEINSKDDLVFFDIDSSLEFNAFETFEQIQAMDNSKQIYEYLVSLSESDPNVIPLDLKEEIRRNMEIERFYGNTKKSSICAYEKKMGPFTKEKNT